MNDLAHPAIALRTATSADALRLGVLATQVFLDTYATDGITDAVAHEVRTAFSTEAFAALLARPGTTITVAVLADALVGFAQTTLGTAQALAPAGAPAELDRLYVQEPYTGCGLGSRLLRSQEAFAAAHGAAVLWLSPWVGNHRALRFYARHGYADHGRVDFSAGAAADREPRAGPAPSAFGGLTVDGLAARLRARLAPVRQSRQAGARAGPSSAPPQ